jgi:hypothetical protein
LKPAAAAPRVAQWLEWEASALRPASYLGGPGLDAALKELAEAAGKGGFLAGGVAPTLADVSGVVRRRRSGRGCFGGEAVQGSEQGRAADTRNPAPRPRQAAVLCTLLPLQRSGALASAPPAVAEFLKRAEGALPVAPALAAVLAGAEPSALVGTFQADAAAHAAAAPKRPLPGKRNVLVRRGRLGRRDGGCSPSRRERRQARDVHAHAPGRHASPTQSARPDHERAAVRQQRAPPRQHHRLRAVGRLLRPLLPLARLQHAVCLWHRRVRNSHRDQGARGGADLPAGSDGGGGGR